MHFANAFRWAQKVRHEFEKRWGSGYPAEKKARRIADLMVIISKACQEIEHVALHSYGWRLDEKEAMRMTEEEIGQVFDAFRRAQDPIAYRVMQETAAKLKAGG